MFLYFVGKLENVWTFEVFFMTNFMSVGDMWKAADRCRKLKLRHVFGFIRVEKTCTITRENYMINEWAENTPGGPTLKSLNAPFVQFYLG